MLLGKRFRALATDSEAVAALSLWMDAVQMRKLDDALIAEGRAELQERRARQVA